MAVHLPQRLRQGLWCVYYTVPRDGAPGKTDKIPCSPVHGRPVSTRDREGWTPFDIAVAASDSSERWSGIGKLILREEELIFVDVDDTTEHELVGLLDTYTEISPSGRGLHMVVHAPGHDQAECYEPPVEVYTGESPRFITITGDVVGCETLNSEVTPLSGYKATHAEPLEDVPELLEDHGLSQVDFRALHYLEEGDRSLQLRANCKRLAGRYSAEQIFTAMCAGPAFEVAMDHRKQNEDRAMAYLWNHHCRDLVSPRPLLDAPPDDAVDPLASFRSFGALATAAGPTSWLVDGMIEDGTVGLLWGPKQTLKSFFTIHLCASIGMGLPFLGRKSTPGVSYYAAGEGVAALGRRFKAWAVHHKADVDAVKMFCHPHIPDISSEAGVADLRRSIRLHELLFGRVRLVAIDTLATSLAGKNEDSADDVSEALRRVREALVTPYRTVLIVHHTGHSAKDRARGSSALGQNVDFEYQSKAEDDTFVIRSHKMKDGAKPPDLFIAGRLVSFDTPRGPSDSLVVVEASERPRTISGNAEKLLSAFDDSGARSLDLKSAAALAGLSISSVRDLLRADRPRALQGVLTLNDGKIERGPNAGG